MLAPRFSSMDQPITADLKHANHRLSKGLVAARFAVGVYSTNIANQGDENYLDRKVTMNATPNGPEIGSLLLDTDPYYMHYDPSNPLADKTGYVRKRKDKTLENSVDMMMGNQWYQLLTNGANTLIKMQQAAAKIGE